MNPEQQIKLLLDQVFDLALKANATLTVYGDGVVVTVAGRFVGSWAGKRVIQLAGGKTPAAKEDWEDAEATTREAISPKL